MPFILPQTTGNNQFLKYPRMPYIWVQILSASAPYNTFLLLSCDPTNLLHLQQYSKFSIFDHYHICSSPLRAKKLKGIIKFCPQQNGQGNISCVLYSYSILVILSGFFPPADQETRRSYSLIVIQYKQNESHFMVARENIIHHFTYLPSHA